MAVGCWYLPTCRFLLTSASIRSSHLKWFQLWFRRHLFPKASPKPTAGWTLTLSRSLDLEESQVQGGIIKTSTETQFWSTRWGLKLRRKLWQGYQETWPRPVNFPKNPDGFPPGKTKQGVFSWGKEKMKRCDTVGMYRSLMSVFICFRSTCMSTSIAENSCSIFPAWRPKTYIEPEWVSHRRMNAPWNAIRVGSDDWKNTTDGNLAKLPRHVTFVRFNGGNPAPW